jgi:hypothetical protein
MIRDYAEILQRFRASCTIRTLDREMAPQALITSGPGPQKKGEHCGHHQNTATPPRPPGRESRRLQRWLARSTRPELIRSSGLYTVLGRAFLTPLLAWPRSYYPTSSVSLRFVPLKCCAGAFVVRPCLPPVGRAHSFPKALLPLTPCSVHRLLS